MHSWTRRVLARLARQLAVFALVASCADNVVYPTLYLSIGAEPTSPRIDRLVVTLGDVTEGRFARAATQPGVAEFRLGDIDISSRPFVVDVSAGTLSQAYLLIRGFAGQTVMASWSGSVQVNEKAEVSIKLLAIRAECDADGDGFVSCAVPGCCGAAGDPVADCDDTVGTGSLANPIASVPGCVPCVAAGAEAVDYDCDGVPDPCLDDDGDLSANCEEASCGSQGDSTVYPGAAEVCDGKDNDCNGTTDDNFGDLDNDKVADCIDDDIDGDGSLNDDDCDPQEAAVHVGAPELCNDRDDDCDGITDEDAPDCGVWDGDWDGDGKLASAGEDCNEYDSRVFKGSAFVGCCDPALQNTLSTEALLAQCDFDCDGFPSLCDVADTDFDTHKDSSAKDCPPFDTDGGQIFKGAPEKCGDGIDQDCSLGDVACSAGEDADGDGYFADVDCNDADETVHPWAPELCDGIDQDCNGFVDDGNPEGGEACVHPTKAEGECLLDDHQGTRVCAHNLLLATAPEAARKQAGGKAVAVICVDYVEPPAKEAACDDRDEDCDGQTDEDFEWTEKQPAAGGGDIVLAKGAICGTGACAGGTVVCDPADPARLYCTGLDNVVPESEGGGEALAFCDNIDNDCDGVVDGHTLPRALTTCKKKGECGVHAAEINTVCNAGTWSCDYDFESYDGEAELRCDGKDNDCDGSTDEDLAWSTIAFGQECNGTGECGVGVVECSQTSGSTAATCSTNPDGSAWVPVVEVCDGKDNDCDGTADDGLTWVDESGTSVPLGQACNGVGECGVGVVICSIGAGKGGQTTCSTNTDGTSSGALVEVCDGKDNDCDGSTDDDIVYQGSPVGGPCDGEGECGVGVVVCSSVTTQPVCSTDVEGTASAAVPEVCDGKDNDCDGETDEGLTYQDPVSGPVGLGGACEGIGECGKGEVVCSPTTLKATCSTNADGTAPEHSVEVCDGKDNDCDGQTDQGLSWKNPVTNGLVPLGATCQGVGKCGNGPAGTVECSQLNNGLATCSTMPDGSEPRNAPQELCNLLDDDCNGTVDDVDGTFAPDVTCKLTGVCNPNNVVATCTAAGEWACSYTGVTDYQASELACDGKDNDCDGQTDDPATVVPPGACATGGVCAGLIETCDGPLGFQCHYESLPDWAPAEESGAYCDGKDNDCDGKTDEKYSQLGTACSEGLHAQCKNTGVLVCGADKNSTTCSVKGKPVGTSCDDGNLCTKTDQCTGGSASDCKGVAYTCASDGLDCTTDACVGDGTCSYALQPSRCLIGGVCYSPGNESPQSDCLACDPVRSTTAFSPDAANTPCNDGNDCNNNDKCNAAGVCSGSGLACPDDGLDCTIDQCTPLGGGDKTCSYATLKANTCLIAGVCYSGGQPNEQNACQVCTPGTSTTAWSNRAAGTLCSDGNKCTLNDACDSGVCVGALNPCDDGESCTDDDCSPANLTFDGCAHVPNTDPCLDDGAACTADVCAAGECTHAVIADFCFIAGTCVAAGESNADKACEYCSPAVSTSTWSDRPATDLCSDGNPCTPTDTCDGNGKCVGSGTLSCDDNNPCTLDLCVAPVGCTYFPQTGAPCASDGLDCTDDVCSSSTCTHALKDDKCLIGGTCYASGATQPGNTCKACTPTTSTEVFSNVADATACQDGDGCTVSDMCVAGACVPGAAPDCSSQANDCNDAKCTSTGATTYNCGKAPKALNTACTSDGLSCTNDRCNSSGTCTHPVTVGCLISGVCIPSDTPDPQTECRACQPTINKTGYSSKANNTPCVGDGLACTSSACNGSGTCLNQQVVNGCVIDGACYANGDKPAGNPCLVCDSVQSTSVWSPVAEGAACDSDGKSCTDDVCGAGSCQHITKTDKCLIGGTCYDSGAPNPGNECQQCVPLTSRSVFTPKAAGTACTDVDGNACTKNECNASAVCTVLNVTDGLVCSDDDLCTFGDQCLAGACTGSPGVACDEGCQTCDGSGGCDLDVGFCLIDTSCVAAGAAKSTTEDCMQCVPGTSTSNWTGVSSGVCYDFADGLIAGNTVCQMGTCSAGLCEGDVGPALENSATGTTCSDELDNDCDGLVDTQELQDCQP